MSRQRSGVGHDNVIANHAIMCDMTVCHEEIAAADYRDTVASTRAAVQTDELPEDIVIADL